MNTSVRQTPRLCISAYLFIYYTLTHIYCTLTHAFNTYLLHTYTCISAYLPLHPSSYLYVSVYAQTHTDRCAHIHIRTHKLCSYQYRHAFSTYLLHTYTCNQHIFTAHLHMQSAHIYCTLTHAYLPIYLSIYICVHPNSHISTGEQTYHTS